MCNNLETHLARFDVDVVDWQRAKPATHVPMNAEPLCVGIGTCFSQSAPTVSLILPDPKGENARPHETKTKLKKDSSTYFSRVSVFGLTVVAASESTQISTAASG